MCSAPLHEGHPASYAACMQAAVELAAPVAQRIATKAGELLLARAAAAADAQERRQCIEAERLLADQREQLRTAFPALLQREIESLELEDSDRAGDVSFGALELMGEEQLDETVEVLRSQQFVVTAVQGDLAQLNALVSAARGRDTVTAAANPLRPEAWVRALRGACEQSRAPAWARARWLAHLSAALGPELASVYRQLGDLLAREGVSAASFTVNVSTPPRPLTGHAAPKAQHQPGGTSLLNLKDLRRLLVGETEGAGPSAWAPAEAPKWQATEHAPPDTVGMTVPYAFEAMQQMTRMDEIMERVQQRRSSGELRQESITPAQALGQEVVRVMVDKITSDARLVPQVRDAVRQLEPALLRLARNDPRFFRDHQHPTRRFLTEMTERSLAWPTPDRPGFAEFFEPLRQAVAALGGLPLDNAEPFEFALQSLLEAWDQQEERGRRERARAARALVKAERRNLLARRIAERLEQRPDVLASAPPVRRFILGPWTQVMAAAQMADPSGSDDPGGYGAVVDDLLWTTRISIDPERRARLPRLVPSLVAALRGGLASIEYPEDRTRRFLSLLADMHRAALREDGDPAPPSPARGLPAHPEEREDSDFWMEPTEAHASSLMQLGPEARPQGDADSVGGRMARIRSVHTPLAITRLQAGAWVDLYLEGAWGRWKLAWASPQGLLFMFADGSGRYRSMTRSVLETLHRIGALRFVSADTIVQGALDAVAETALRNSMLSAY